MLYYIVCVYTVTQTQAHKARQVADAIIAIVYTAPEFSGLYGGHFGRPTESYAPAIKSPTESVMISHRFQTKPGGDLFNFYCFIICYSFYFFFQRKKPINL